MTSHTNTCFIRTNYIELKDNLHTPRIIDYCFQNDVISQDDKEEINTGSSRSAKNGTFLDLLIRKSTSSPSVRDVFIKALQYYQPDLLLRLKKPQLTYADALKKPDSPVPTWRQMPVHKCESSGIDVDLRLLDPHYILTLVCSVEKKLNELLASQQLNELKKYLCHLTYIFNCQSYAPILEDFIKDSLLHKRLFDICKQPLTENLQETNNNYLDIGLSSLQLTSIISGQHVAFCQHLCEKENILFLFDILKEVHTTVHSRNARLERKGIDMQTASLLIFYNIVLNKNKFDHIITESTFLHTLRIYMKSEESVHRVTSILIMIHLNTFCESTLDDCAKDILTTLTSWLKAIWEDSNRVKNPRPDATAVIRGLKKLATIQIFSTKLQENQYIMSLSKSNCWTKEPTAAPHFIKLLSKLNLIGARNNKENKRKSVTMTIQKFDMNLLIIGSGGAGKSSLGNSILGRQAFKVSNEGDETAVGVSLETGSFNGRTLNVVDTPSVGNKCSIKNLCQDLDKSFSFSHDGFHAILLVVQYGFSNFNQHDLKSIEDFKKILGRYFLKDYGVLVFTCGDYFKKDHLKVCISFEDWLTMQGSLLHDLITECKNRAVLFDNMTQDQTQRHLQLNGLLHLVDKMRLSDYMFSSEYFQRAKDSRDEFIRWEADRNFHRNISEEVKILERDLETVSLKVKTDNQKSELQKILGRARNLAVRVSSWHAEEFERGKNSLSQRVQEIISGAENQKKLLRGIAYNKRKLKPKSP